MKHEGQLKALLTHDPARMKILRIARDLNLPDCWIAAGFVHGVLNERTPCPSLMSQAAALLARQPNLTQRRVRLSL